MNAPLQLSFRRAELRDVAGIVALLADDVLGREREAAGPPLPAEYASAFAAIDADPNQELLVCERDGAAVGTLQLTFVRGLSRQGALRAQLEAVRVAAAERGHGVGTQMLAYAVNIARRRGARTLQLTTDKSRTDAQRFYRRHGFVASHEGMKLELPPDFEADHAASR